MIFAAVKRFRSAEHEKTAAALGPTTSSLSAGPTRPTSTGVSPSPHASAQAASAHPDTAAEAIAFAVIGILFVLAAAFRRRVFAAGVIAALPPVLDMEWNPFSPTCTRR